MMIDKETKAILCIIVSALILGVLSLCLYSLSGVVWAKCLILGILCILCILLHYSSEIWGDKNENIEKV